MIERGSVCEKEDAGPGNRRYVVVVQADSFNRSLIPTLLVVPLSSQARLAEAPGNVVVPARASGLLRDTVAVVSGLESVPRRSIRQTAARVAGPLLESIEQGLRLVLGI